jgi:aspartate racemase
MGGLHAVSRAIGIIGGMSPESTMAYYRRIVHRHQQERGDHGYPRLVIASVSFQQYIDWQHAGEWDRIATGLSAECRAVAAAGAELAVIATNTMHKVFDDIDSPLPMLHIVDAVADAAAARGVRRVGLTGTRFTMADPFYADALRRRGLDVVVPAAAQQTIVHDIIYGDLIAGRVPAEAVRSFLAVSDDLLRRGAECVLLACTELAMLVDEADHRFLDTTTAHADRAWEIAMGSAPLERRSGHGSDFV